MKYWSFFLLFAVSGPAIASEPVANLKNDAVVMASQTIKNVRYFHPRILIHNKTYPICGDGMFVHQRVFCQDPQLPHLNAKLVNFTLTDTHVTARIMADHSVSISKSCDTYLEWVRCERTGN